MKSAVLLLLAVLLVGCAAEAPEDSVSISVHHELSIPHGQQDPIYSKVWRIVIDTWTDEQNRGEILQALEAWQNVIPCPTLFDVSYEPVTDELPVAGTITIRLASFPDGATIGYAHWGDSSAGARVLLLPKNELGHDAQRVVRHELGHAMGLPHQSGIPSIMLDPPVHDNKIYPVDIQSYVALWCPDR